MRSSSKRFLKTQAKSLKTRRRSELGVALPEMAIILFVLVLMVLGSIDISRYYWLKRQLDHAAFRGLVAATTDPGFFVDLHGASPGDDEYRVYEQSYVKIATAAAVGSDIFMVIGPPGSGRVAELLEYEHPLFDFSSHPNWVKSFAVLRPYECMHKTVGTNPTGCTEADPECLRHPAYENRIGYPCLDKVQGVERYMREEPIYVEVRAELEVFTPVVTMFYGPTIITGSALGFREEVPKGSLDALLGGSGSGATTTTTTSSTTTLTTVTTTTLPPEACSPDIPKCLKDTNMVDPLKEDGSTGNCNCYNPVDKSL